MLSLQNKHLNSVKDRTPSTCEDTPRIQRNPREVNNESPPEFRIPRALLFASRCKRPLIQKFPLSGNPISQSQKSVSSKIINYSLVSMPETLHNRMDKISQLFLPGKISKFVLEQFHNQCDLFRNSVMTFYYQRGELRIGPGEGPRGSVGEVDQS